MRKWKAKSLGIARCLAFCLVNGLGQENSFYPNLDIYTDICCRRIRTAQIYPLPAISETEKVRGYNILTHLDEIVSKRLRRMERCKERYEYTKALGAAKLFLVESQKSYQEAEEKYREAWSWRAEIQSLSDALRFIERHTTKPTAEQSEIIQAVAETLPQFNPLRIFLINPYSALGEIFGFLEYGDRHREWDNDPTGKSQGKVYEIN